MPRIDTVISIREFAREIIRDFPRLIEEQPEGLTTSFLSGYYGESLTRCMRVMSVVEAMGRAKKITLNNGSFVLVPKGKEMTDVLLLTDLQQRVLVSIRKICNNPQNKASTNMQRLATLARASSSGVKHALNILEGKEYVKTEEYDQRDHSFIVVDLKKAS